MNLSKFSINQDVDNRDYKGDIYNKRLELINIATEWPGSEEKNHFIIHKIWEYPVDPSYSICFGKYGKEYYEIKNGVQKNANDMKPCVFKDGQIVDSFRGRFDDIFALLENLHRDGKDDVVRAFAVLFFRNSILLDHSIVNGEYYYTPDQELVDYICENIPEYEGIPMEVYIHVLDAIGYNEDVKYFTQGLLQKKTGIGRENNMKTYSYAAICVLGHENWAGFIYKLMRGYGVAPVTNKMFAQYFPEMGIAYRESTPRAKRVNSEIITVDSVVSHI